MRARAHVYNQYCHYKHGLLPLYKLRRDTRQSFADGVSNDDAGWKMYSGTLAWLTGKLLAVPFDSSRTFSPAPLSSASKLTSLRRRIYCLSPGEAWFHQYLIDRFSPRLLPRRRWIRTTSRSDPPRSLGTRTKFSVRTVRSWPSFLHPSVPLVFLIVTAQDTAEILA